ncbi:NucA/NucB deoxyribonuclease domain-containing protein [Streptomyces fradiae]|uniref:NucA/NucB deoxyribonuclease domain-containing protein n=1 Tax=Streptomyces fradiae TaxID=1906 RepID=UPI002943E31B|nr:hypothetical protein [Streptomyces fradiae]WOI63056.1 hypothetical protein RYQ63_25960 [Streptomyces fradiae]
MKELPCRQLPVHVVDGKRPQKSIVISDKSAIDSGKSMVLHCNGGGKKRDENRELAGCAAAWQGSHGCDEYPSAMAQEGGFRARAMGVPYIPEQRIQGLDLARLVTTNKLKRGDPFMVLVINVRKECGVYVAG